MSNAEKYHEILRPTSSSRLCVIAGPGTGKTKCVLIPKTEALLASGVPAEEILLLSFSRLSAADLKGRVQGAISASTVHSCCLAFLLSENNHRIRDRIDSIVLEFEEKTLLSDLKVVFPAIHKNTLKKMLSEYKAGWAKAQQDSVLEHDDTEQRFKNAVMKWLEEHSAALLGEIMYSGVELIRDLGGVGFLSRYKYILIDEYQDLNKLEQEFVGHIATGANLLLVVGDPDQSIYAFKFAHPDGIRDFEKSAESHYLEFCGRCGRKIVDFANKLLIQANPARTQLPKPLSTNPEGEVIMPPPFQVQSNEFRYTLGEVARRLKQGVKPEEILVLVPKTGLAAEFIKTITTEDRGLFESFGASIESTSKGGHSNIEQRAILLFALLAKPNSLLHARVYTGLGDDHAYAAEFQKLKARYGDLRNALDQASADDFPKSNKRARMLCEEIATLKTKLAEYGAMTPKDAVDALFPSHDTQLAWINDALAALKEEEEDTLEILYQKFSDYVRSSKSKPGIIRVMTLGMSKGLDADHVFILGASSGNIPGKNRYDHLSDTEFANEQRRLLYVGITRAKLSITITWSRSIPFRQSQTHQTVPVRVRRRPGSAPEVQLAICEFLRGLRP